MFQRIKQDIKSTYNSTFDDISNTFYNRILQESISYNRVSGYFSSKGLSQYAIGLDKLFKNNGTAHLIISSDVSENDFNEIKAGYDKRSAYDQLTEYDRKLLGNLAYMIAIGRVDIKFGLIDNGLFHSKWGLFTDNDGETIYFMGSNNETFQALNHNYEDFDVDFSWDISPYVRQRITEKKQTFEKLWANQIQGVDIVNANDVVYKLVAPYDKGHIQYIQESTDNALVLTTDSSGWVFEDHSNYKISTLHKFQQRLRAYTSKENGFPYLKNDLNYRQLETIIDRVNHMCQRKDIKFVIDSRVKTYIDQHRYTIEEFDKAGLTLKDDDQRWATQYTNFSRVVNQEIVRPLKPLQMKSAFYMYIQKHAANFSVPGSGKTAMLLGVFAYLNQTVNPKIKRLLVVSPINAFMSWKDEFVNVFGDKKQLRLMTVHDEGVTTTTLRTMWYQKNLVLVNYESLQTYGDALVEALKNDDGQTLLVFDEVHRIKGVESKRAQKALEIAKYAPYKYVLTGTPIPNTYQDVWNFLHILFNDEYNSYFGFELNALKSPNENDVQRINRRIRPFFWRTSKSDLGVPLANDDIIYECPASPEQMRLAETIYTNESNPLAIMIRMLQLSTNPQLLSQQISYADLGVSGEDGDSYNQVSQELAQKLQKEIHDNLIDKISDIDLENIETPKYTRGIQLVNDLVSQHKRVIVWGLFVNTLDRITEDLNKRGISAKVIYGATPKDERDQIIREFKKSDSSIQVLVSNPNTLGESVSLHMFVHDAVYFEYNYNLTFMLQSRDRIHRLGLPTNVETNYYYLMTTSNATQFNFIDKKVYTKLHEKELRMKSAIDEDILMPEFSDDEFSEMKAIINGER